MNGQHVRREREVETVRNGVGEDLSEIPAVRLVRGQDTVDGEGHDGTIVEKGDDQDHERREVELEREGEDGEADNDTDGDRARVDGVVAHTLEDDARAADGVDDGGQTGLREDDVSSRAGSVSGTLDGDTDIGARESGRVVGTVTGHGAEVAESLETLDDLVLVLGEDTSETVGVEDHLVEVPETAAGLGAVLKNLRGVHVVTEAETTTGLLRNSELVTGNHLDLDTEGHGVVDRLLGVVTRGVEDGEETNELEAVTLTLGIVAVNLLVRNRESTETTLRVLLDVSLETVLELVGLVARAELDDDTGHALGDTLELAGRLLAVGDLRALVNGVERLEVKELDTSASARRIADGTNDARVDSVLVLGTGGVRSQKDDIVGGERGVGAEGSAIDGKLVGGECTSLVRAQNSDGGKLLDGGDTGDNGLVLRELLRTDGERDGKDSGHRNGDTTDQEDEDVVETAAVRVAEAGIQAENLGDDEDTNDDQAEGPDLGKNLLQVTGGVIVLTDKGGGTTEESVGTSGDDDTLSFTLLASRTTIGADENHPM